MKVKFDFDGVSLVSKGIVSQPLEKEHVKVRAASRG
jgi:hypothetical protein